MILTVLAAVTVCATVTVWDGDSLRCNGEKIRIANIDADEMPHSIRCTPQRVRQLRYSRNPPQCDHAKAERARAALRAFLARGEVAVHPTGKRSYDRILARVTVDSRDAGEFLISRGLARRWR